MNDYHDYKRQSWKRAEHSQNERKFVFPKDEEVNELDDFFEYGSAKVSRPTRGLETFMKLLAVLFGFVLTVAVYAPAFYFGVRALGAGSFDYRDAVIVSACFVFVRAVDTTVMRNRDTTVMRNRDR